MKVGSVQKVQQDVFECSDKIDMNDEAGSSSAVPLDAPPRRSTETSAAPIVEDAAPSFYFSRKPRLQDLITVLDRVIWLEITIVYLLEYARSSSIHCQKD